MVAQEKPTAVDQLPLWNYDGSSCGQAPGDDSEVMLRPVKIYPVSTLWLCYGVPAAVAAITDGDSISPYARCLSFAAFVSVCAFAASCAQPLGAVLLSAT